AAVRIPVRVAERPLDRLDRLRERPERAPVRSYLAEAVYAERPLDGLDRLSRLVGDEVAECRANDRQPGPCDRGHAAGASADGPAGADGAAEASADGAGGAGRGRRQRTG